MKPDVVESQRRRLKRTKTTWPRQVRSKYLVRWLYYLGPLVFRILRTLYSLFDGDG